MANDSSSGIPPIPPRYVGLDDAETFGRLISRPGRPDHTADAFFAEWIAGFPAALEIVSGDDQTGSTGTVLAAPLVVRVLDTGRNAVAGAPVSFRVRDRDARIDGRITATVLTGHDGRATAARWRLGQTAGPQHVDVSVDRARATFSADATLPGYPASASKPQLPPKSSGSRTS